jgi:DNA-binding HxlR family transcriptional regulator
MTQFSVLYWIVMSRLYTSYCSVSTDDLIELFHHRWAAPALALLADRGGARFVELQRRLGVGRESLRRALDALIDAGLARRNEGYGHPLRPEYVVTAKGRRVARIATGVVAAGDDAVLLRKWSVPVLSVLGAERRFTELRSSLSGITPRALAHALRELEDGGYVDREVVATRPPSTIYRPTRRGRRVQQAV